MKVSVGRSERPRVPAGGAAGVLGRPRVHDLDELGPWWRAAVDAGGLRSRRDAVALEVRFGWWSIRRCPEF